MPTWHLPTDESQVPTTDLSSIMRNLSMEIATEPSVWDVTGVDSQDLLNHAMEAISAYIKTRDIDPTDPVSWAQVYILGFIVGMKYEQGKEASAQHHIERNTDERTA